MQFSELKHAIDSLYHTSLYVDGSYGDSAYPCSNDAVEYYDTVQVYDPDALSSQTDASGDNTPGALRLLCDGSTRGSITQQGYLRLQGTTPNDTMTGLLFGQAVGLHPDGDLCAGDSLIANKGTYLDTADFTGSLIVRNGCGDVVGEISDADTLKLRAWAVERFVDYE